MRSARRACSGRLASALAWRSGSSVAFVMLCRFSGMLPGPVPGRFPRCERVAMRNLSLKYGPRVAAFSTLLGGFVGSALAAVPAAFTDAIDDATTDGAAMASALLGVAAAVVIVMIALKFVKRIKGAV